MIYIYIYLTAHCYLCWINIFSLRSLDIYTLCLSPVGLARLGSIRYPSRGISCVSPNSTRRKNARYADIKVLVLNIRGRKVVGEKNGGGGGG